MVICFILGSISTSAKTRSASVGTFLDSVRLSSQGFANTPSDVVDIVSTQEALEVKSILNLEVNNSLDVLLFIQSSQNSDGGFGITDDIESSWEGTVAAVQGLITLGYNTSVISRWTIFQYFNVSATSILYDEGQNGNQTILIPKSLTYELLSQWSDYLSISFLLGQIPAVPYEFLTEQILNYQYSNGTYIDLEIATEAIILGSYLGITPIEEELASNFIRAYKTSNAFSFGLNAQPTLSATLKSVQALSALGRLHEIDDMGKLIQFVLGLQYSNSGFGENGDSSASLISTWRAIKILSILSAITELNAPEVLQTEGFVLFNLIWYGLFIQLMIIKRRLSR